jgi:hypothetical protein
VTPEPTITIARRYAGPPESGNGGYTAGRLAGRVGSQPVTVTLRKPPPLDQPLTLSRVDGGSQLTADAGELIAEASSGHFDHQPVAPVSRARAESVQAAYPGLFDHSFNGCFVCGPERTVGDGMRLCPGPISADRSACVWTPDESLADTHASRFAALEFVWAALDCPGGWTSDLIARPLVLGRMTGAVHRLPEIGRPVVIVGELYETVGRKTRTGTAAYDENNRLVGRAEQVWIEVDPDTFYPGSTATG